MTIVGLSQCFECHLLPKLSLADLLYGLPLKFGWQDVRLAQAHKLRL
jgi:hypothetical protein